MAYSKQVIAALKQAGASEGDLVRIVAGTLDFTGTLLPKAGGNDNCIVIKLPSGYDLGIECGHDCRIEKVAERQKHHKPQAPAPKKRDGKALPEVSIVATGGTISAKVDYELGGVTSALAPEEIFEAAPELDGIVHFRKMLSPFRMLSENMGPREWQGIAHEVAKELNSGADGVVVMHGTDTLHYTAAALSFMLTGLSKPVALVGAMKSPDRGSFDGTMNLVAASNYAGRGDFSQVAIVMHANADDSYCHALRGTKARKMHTSRRDAFRPINDLPLARLWPDGRIEKLQDCPGRSEGKVVAKTDFEEKTALIKAYPGSSPDLLEFLTSKKYKGVVIEGTALGHVAMRATESKFAWAGPLKNAVDSGMVVAVATQCLYGSTNAFVYETARLMQSLGAIYCGDMLPETAYVKLGWALANRKSDVAAAMAQNLAGELNQRLTEKQFMV